MSELPKILPVLTEDGNYTFYNFEVQDIYHSKIGAYTEAIHKFILPSDLKSIIKAKKEINILDICYGLGFNSKAAYQEIKKINPECKVNITALENDKLILALSCIPMSKEIKLETESLFYRSLNSVFDINAELKSYAESIAHSSPFIKSYLPKQYNFKQIDSQLFNLHNIYYRSVSTRNINQDKVNNANGLDDVVFFVQDARTSLSDLSSKFDLIFLDSFTPRKAPQLWTVEFFSQLRKILAPEGKLLTYSSSAAIRGGLIEAGFKIGRTDPVEKKTSGTIAVLSDEIKISPITENEIMVLNSKAGLPYRDNSNNLSAEEILSLRKAEQQSSDKIGSSKIYKKYLV